MAQMYNWINIIQPKISILKFRLPFYDENIKTIKEKSQKMPYKNDLDMAIKYGLNFVDNYINKKTIFLSGTLNIQAFAPGSSTETRLITDGLNLKDYGSYSEYENKFYYYNNIERCFGLHYNDNADKTLGFDHCSDCALENLLWKNYKLYSNNNDINIKDMVYYLSLNTSRSLLIGNHGKFFEPYNIQKLTDAVINHNKNPKRVSLIY
jgi:hypothetical protein